MKSCKVTPPSRLETFYTPPTGYRVRDTSWKREFLGEKPPGVKLTNRITGCTYETTTQTRPTKNLTLRKKFSVIKGSGHRQDLGRRIPFSESLSQN